MTPTPNAGVASSDRAGRSRAVGPRPFTVEPDFAHGLHPREDIIDCLTAQPHELAADDSRHKILRHLHDFLRGGSVESPAKDGGHRLGQRLHLRSERNAKMRLPVGVNIEKYSHRVGAFLVLAHILEGKSLAGPRRTASGTVRIGDEVFPLFLIREHIEELDDLSKIRRVWSHSRCQILDLRFPPESPCRCYHPLRLREESPDRAVVRS